MCSFLVTTKVSTPEEIHTANIYQKYRGPDKTTITAINGITLVHNLLSITGEFTTQPFMSNDVVAIYNGEIYNYKDILPSANSDGECILVAYERYGDAFLKHLDGEFAVVLIDLKQQKIIFGLDTFGCKPMFYSLTDGYHFASYSSALSSLNIKNIKQIEGNEWFIYNIKENTLIKNTITIFDVNREYKNSFDDWNIAFEESIKKRAICPKPVMMGVSEGYDSGSISCSLNIHNIPFKAYSVNVLEQPSNVLLWRHDIINKDLPTIDSIKIITPKFKNKVLMHPTLLDHINIHHYAHSKCEPYSYTFLNHTTEKLETKICRDTYGFLGAAFILKSAREEGYRVCLSGLAGDIIGSPDINNKIKKYKNLNYVVDYDDNNVYSCEYCCGVHGIEIRYPFLDTKLWQETLWLNKSIYKHWKHPQRQYMLKHNFPFVAIDDTGAEIFEKVGFYREMPQLFNLYTNTKNNK